MIFSHLQNEFDELFQQISALSYGNESPCNFSFSELTKENNAPQSILSYGYESPHVIANSSF